MNGSENPQISVVIPTYNRAAFLKSSLKSLAEQTLPASRFEVLVVDDGSQDETESVCRKWSARFPLRYLFERNSGISAAKNLGVVAARGDIIFFFDDDDVAHEDLLQEHLKIHESCPQEHVAVLGHTQWHPSLPVTEVMHFVTDVGHYLFSYSSLNDGQELDYTYFWGGRSSCKRSFLLRHGVFNPVFRFGSEDIELGYRLSRHNLKVIYNRKAASFMLRAITYDDFCRRCQRQGMSQYLFSQLHPDPVIQRWCQVPHAEERWQYLKDTLERDVQAVHSVEWWLAKACRIENLLREDVRRKAGQRSALSVEAEPFLRTLFNDQTKAEKRKLLHTLYWRTFDAFKTRGVVEAMQAHRSKRPSPGLRQAVRNPSDLDHVRRKWTQRPAVRPRPAILVIDLFLPFYDRASGSLRSFCILKALRQMGYHVTFLAKHATHAEHYTPILQQLGIEVFAGDPLAVRASGGFEPAPLVDYSKVLRNRDYEVAIISFWDSAEYYVPLIRKHSPKTKIIVDTVDIVFVRRMREAQVKRDEKLRHQAIVDKHREIDIYRQADRLWVVTDNDRNAIAGLVGSVPIDTVPNIHGAVTHSKRFEETRDLLFVGNFWHAPNVDAIEYFCREVLPIIHAALPAVKLHVVGDHVPPTLQALACDRVVFTGYVPDLAPHLRQARVSIAPLRFGAGMKGKIGEALSWGLPVVTTSIGAEGMELTEGLDILTGDTPADFARQVIRLYSDPDLWEMLASNGKKSVERRWSPEIVRTKLEASLGTLLTESTTVTSMGTTRAPEQKQPFRAEPTPGLTSIIILTMNQLEYTQQCVESVRKHTSEPHEIVFVDNGSSDGTVPWLREQVTSHANCRLIENATNRGFSQGCNQGIEASTGEYLLLLNNDVVVTDGWLGGLLECLTASPDVGVVGPMTNNISGIQRVRHNDYVSLDEMHEFARSFRTLHRHRRFVCRRIVGFCMLFRRSLVDAIGALDTSFGTGNFEDDDFCLRSVLAGRHNRIAADVFVHHYGSRTFIGNGIDYQASLSGNMKIFDDKWNSLDARDELGKRYLVVKALERAEILAHRNETAKAFRVLVDALKHAADEPRIYCAMADVFLYGKEYQNALESLESAPAEARKDPTWLLLMAHCQAGLGNFADAEKYALRVLALQPSSAHACNLLGSVARQEGETAVAAEWFEKALSMDAGCGAASTNLGLLRWDSGHHDEAMDLLERGFIRAPAAPDSAQHYHTAAAERGQLDRAERMFRAALDIYPNNKNILFLLIDILLTQSKFQEAMNLIEFAIYTYGIEQGLLDAAQHVRNILGPLKPAREPGEATISLCMIVKNEELHLPRCLMSVKPIVDEIIVVDTGSTDNTPAIARVFGAEVHDFVWHDDFSAARNGSLSHATGDWVLVLDADEVISPRDHAALLTLVNGSEPEPRAYSLVTRNYLTSVNASGWSANDGSYPLEEKGTGWIPSWKVRLFPRMEQIRFEYRVHELVEPSLLRHGIPVEDGSVPIHHYGKLHAERNAAKGEDYLLMGLQKLEDIKDDPRALRELAVQASELGRFEEALAVWEKFLRIEPRNAMALSNMGYACLKLGRFADGARVCKKALAIDGKVREARYNCAYCQLFCGDIADSLSTLESLLQEHPDYLLAKFLLAVAYCCVGRRQAAVGILEELTLRHYDLKKSLIASAERLMVMDRPDAAQSLLEAAMESGNKNQRILELLAACRTTFPPRKGAPPVSPAGPHLLRRASQHPDLTI
jgi:glycosyltransferase involved in cell wall biosynthesis